jgi:hypothetical protein
MKTISLAFAALALAGNFAVAQDKTYPIGNTGMIGVRHGNVARTYKNGVLMGGPGSSIPLIRARRNTIIVDALPSK